MESHKADSISVSWGSFEWFNNLANDPVTDPYTGKTVSSLQATHEIFLQAALQGVTTASTDTAFVTAGLSPRGACAARAV